MINDTINNTLIDAGSKIDFAQWTKITQDPIFLISALIVWLFPLILMLIIGACVKGGSGSSSKKMIEFPNFWIIWFTYFFIQSALFLILLIFPVWLGIGGT